MKLGVETNSKEVRMEQAIQRSDAKIYPEVRYEGKKGQVTKKPWPDGEEEPLSLTPSLMAESHSSEFGWGRSGSAPAQLAIALLLDATSDPQKARDYSFDFCHEKVGTWGKNWSIYRSDILNWLRKVEEREIEERIMRN